MALQKDIMEMKADLTQTVEENAQLKDTVARIESANEYLQMQQNNELAEIEDRVEHLMKDNQDLKNENVELKAGAAGLKKQMAQADEQHKTLKDKYAKAKNNNQNLKLQLENVEKKVRDYLQEKALEV